MSFKVGDKVKQKTWKEISKTVVPFTDKTIDAYRHKDTGLIYNILEFSPDEGKVMTVNGRDEDGDYELKGSWNYYHESWLEKVK